MDFDIKQLVRPHLLTLKPYASARSEFSGHAQVWLDANENAYGTPGREISEAFHRYPDPYQTQLKEKISELKGVPHEQIFLGNGSDEAIDLLIKAFCRPGRDNVIALPPTFGMYEVAAAVNDVEVHAASLTDDYQIDREAVEKAIDANTKLLFFCSPNNPTGNLLNPDDIRHFLDSFQGIVVVDEAYIDFTGQAGFLPELAKYPNLVVLQTFSKAWGMAALRLGVAYASAEIVGILNKIKLPYNVSTLTQQTALAILENADHHAAMVDKIMKQRAWLQDALQRLTTVENIYPSDANFMLVRVQDAHLLYDFLVREGVVVRNRANVRLCEGALRITVGTETENQALIEKIEQFELEHQVHTKQ
uniref:Histidinol-phosphate aminotransferase n=1 Tax=Roseihalotalea indica TaxID=2867963 RepID=A0AA49GMG9_9BACT|nr:histidinol-phosphate transaminase [Tunicatimonas sp. TK19036]